MSILKFVFPFLFALTFAACEKEEGLVDDLIDSSNPTLPSGVFQIDRAGLFQEQNGYTAEGTAQLGTDDGNNQWLRFAPDFRASLSTGAVTVYLSKNQNLTLNNAGSFVRVSLVTKPGEHFYKIDPAVGADFKFAILWCASASVQFGNAELK